MTADDVYFSELSPRPHDTGMVTLAGTTELSEFELHARAVLGYPISEITLKRPGVSAVILAAFESPVEPSYEGLEQALAEPRAEVRIFGKPSTREYRRMGVALVHGDWGMGNGESNMDALRAEAKKIADMVRLLPGT